MLRYPLVCFDLDGTLVDDTIYIWKTLHDEFETDPIARRRAYDDYFAGRISYEEWFSNDLVLLRAAGATRAEIDRILGELRPMNGAAELIADLRSKGYKLAVISGSLDVVLGTLYDESLFDHILINKIFFSDDGTISGGEPTPYDLQGKADGLAELARREGLTLDQTVFVGDNENDVWIARVAGMSIAFNCKSDHLRQVADHEVVEKDLRAISSFLHSS